MINWKVRIKNKYFWLTLIPAVLLLVEEVLEVFGISFEPTALADGLKAIVGSVFSILAILGIVNDPTTATLADSVNALTYDTPKVSELDTEAEKGDDNENNTEISSEE